MYAGTVMSFCRDFGFIRADGEKKDTFVHYSDIVSDGFKYLTPGDRVIFEKKRTSRGLKAVCVTKIGKEVGV